MKHINNIFGNFRDIESYNLHNHTVYSDGSHSPEELILKAREKLITVLSITDHDTIKAYTHGNAMQIAQNKNITIIPGVEATVKGVGIDGYTSHLLMYFKQKLLKDSGFLDDFNNTIGQARNKNTLEIRLASLNREFGLLLSLDDFIIDGKFFNTNSYIIKKVIKEKNPHFSKEEIDFMLGNKSPAHKEFGTSINDLSYLRFKYDMVSVLAHPLVKRDIKDEKKVDEIVTYIQKLTSSGIVDGLELYHPDVNDVSREVLKQFNLVLYTAGSDTHNKTGERRILNNTGVSQILNKDFEVLNKKSQVAVMIGRLNPPHIGHIRVIKKALSENDTLVLFLGSANVVNEKNPFTFEERKMFLEGLFEEEVISGKMIISYLDDVPNDGTWTKNLGKKIKELNAFGFGVNFYGGDFNEDRAINVIREHQKKLSIENVKYTQVPREHFTLPDGQDISATNLRKALGKNDLEGAKKFMLTQISDLVIRTWEKKESI